MSAESRELLSNLGGSLAPLGNVLGCFGTMGLMFAGVWLSYGISNLVHAPPATLPFFIVGGAIGSLILALILVNVLKLLIDALMGRK